MKKKQVRELRTELGKTLHEFYINNGEEEYEKFLDEIGNKIAKEYGEPFSSDNLRIMEAEYVTFNATFNEKDKSSNTKTSFKE